MKKWLLFLTLAALLVNICEAKLQIDVSVRLAEGLCAIVKKSVESKQPSGDLKQTAKPQEGECFIWRWVRCDHNAKQPCSTWEKKPCEANDGRSADGVGQGFCDIYQCGWTIDELHENWGYNPVLHHEEIKDKPPNDELIQTGSTLDYPKSIT